MKTIFLSWSGDRSRKLAAAFEGWLPTVIQGIDPYFSQQGIRSGARWFAEISGQLDNNSFGLLFMTRDNLGADWIMFEAGAIGKAVGTSYVCPIVFDVSFGDLHGPLKEFQARSFDRDGIWALVQDINAARNEEGIQEKHLQTSFDRAWPELETTVNAILTEKPPKDQAPVRSLEDKIDEILEMVRSIARKPAQGRSEASVAAEWPQASLTLKNLITRLNELPLNVKEEDSDSDLGQTGFGESPPNK